MFTACLQFVCSFRSPEQQIFHQEARTRSHDGPGDRPQMMLPCVVPFMHCCPPITRRGRNKMKHVRRRRWKSGVMWVPRTRILSPHMPLWFIFISHGTARGGFDKLRLSFPRAHWCKVHVQRSSTSKRGGKGAGIIRQQRKEI